MGNMRMPSFSLIGVPSSAGAHHAGVELAPDALRAAGLLGKLRDRGMDVVDVGDVAGATFVTDRIGATARNLEAVVAAAQSVAVAVREARLAGRVPIVLGGDCTITLGVVAGLQGSGDVSLLYFDGDADLNAPAGTRSGVLDATGVAHLLGIADTPLSRIGHRFPMLKPEQLILLGYDPTDPDSFDGAALTARPTLRHYPGSELSRNPVEVARRALSGIPAAQQVVVHFDVDAVNSGDLPLANFPHYGQGVTLEQAGAVLRELLTAPALSALVLTEVNPTHDPSGHELARYVEAVVQALASAVGSPTAASRPLHSDKVELPRADVEAIQDAQVSVGGPELLPDLEPLWLTLFDHHLEIGAAGLPAIDRTASWGRRRALYESFLSQPGTFIVLAKVGDQPAGYVFAHVRPGDDDTWNTGPQIGHIDTLVVLPSERGNGLGTILLDTAERRFEESGVRDIELEVVAGNDRAMAYYQRRGMRVVLSTLLRIGTRPDSISK